MGLQGWWDGKVGFEAYASHIELRKVQVRSLVWQPTARHYAPEF
jgi:hypothetical protein